MSFQVVVTPEADADVRRIYRWIADRSIDGARRWYREWFNAQRSLEQNPFLFGLAPESDSVTPEIRQVIFRTRKGLPYRVLFWIDEKTIYVLHVRGPGEPPVPASKLALG